MGPYRKFLYGFVGCFLLFIAGNFLIWKCCTEKLLTTKYGGGDLARMGYVMWAKDPRTNSIDLPVRHLEQEEYDGRPVRVLTFGDSFSNGGGGGRNTFYQDYIASINNCGVLNIEPWLDPDFLTTVAMLCNNGYLDKVRPTYLLLSCSEKFCVQRFARDVDFTSSATMEELSRHKRMGYRQANAPGGKANGVSFINTGNYKLLTYNLSYLLPRRFHLGKVYQAELRESFFGNTPRKSLLYYREDVTAIPLATPASMAKINDNLNTLADMLARRGIRLYFMPCVDKYDLYRDYMVDASLPKSVFFEELRKLPRRYALIDTKAILSEEVRRGEKDIFYADDTHWSWKAAQKVFETVRFP